MSSITSRPVYAAVVLFVLVGIPVAYLAVNHWRAPGKAEPPAASSAPVTLADLEERERADPSVKNRLDLSRALINAGRQGRAISLLKPIVASDPNNSSAWNNLCVAYTLQQEYNHAIPACESGVRLAPTVQLFKNNLQWAQNEAQRARDQVVAEEGTPEPQRNAAFYLAEGLNYLHLGNYEQAHAAFQRCLDLAPSNAEAQNNLGVVEMMLLHYKDAQASFRKALAMDPGMQLAKNNLQWALSEEAATH